MQVRSRSLNDDKSKHLAIKKLLIILIFRATYSINQGFLVNQVNTSLDKLFSSEEKVSVY